MLTQTFGENNAARFVTAVAPTLAQSPVQILGQEKFTCLMGLDYYSDAPFDELTGIEEWAATTEGKVITTAVMLLQFLRPVGAVIGGIHGYNRHQGNWGAALGWSAAGFIFPTFTAVAALAQGYGKPKGLGYCPR